MSIEGDDAEAFARAYTDWALAHAAKVCAALMGVRLDAKGAHEAADADQAHDKTRNDRRA